MTQTQTLRNASLPDMLEVLNRQHELKYDAVVPSTHLLYEGGNLVVEDVPVITDDGVDSVVARFAPSQQFEDHLAERLDIPVRYLRKMREADAWHLLDYNVNHWLGEAERNYFIRGFRSEEGPVGIARAILSDRYQVIDHLDAVFAVLDGIREAGVHVNVVAADLSERKLRIKVEAPEITAAAPRFLDRYRPTHAYEMERPDLISAGLGIWNSETGGAAFGIAPHFTIQICKNGMTRTKDAMRRVHLGGRMQEGVIAWSQETKRQEIELIRHQARDAVRTFLSQDYLERVVNVLETQGETLLTRPLQTIEDVAKRLRYSEEERQAIVDLFVDGGDTRASGVVQAFTAYARDVDDPDRAAEIEEQSFDILEMAGA